MTTIRVDEETFSLLSKIQGVIQIKEARKVSLDEVISEMCKKWDSLIKSYEGLKSLSSVE